MKKRIKYGSYLVVVVLVAICFEFGSSSPQPARAHAPQDDGVDGADFLAWQRTVGIVPGQVVRITVANLADTRSPGPLSFQCMVFDQNGTLVGESQRTEVPAGQFRGADFLYGGFGMDGEPGTGRKQLGLKVEIRTPRGTRSSNVVGSLELINGDTGETAINVRFHDLIVTSFQTSGTSR